MPQPHPLFVRNLQAGQLRETFLVSAVASFLGVRFFLNLTGFPRLGGGGLHIAHMLWGGGLMLTALLFTCCKPTRLTTSARPLRLNLT